MLRDRRRQREIQRMWECQTRRVPLLQRRLRGQPLPFHLAALQQVSQRPEPFPRPNVFGQEEDLRGGDPERRAAFQRELQLIFGDQERLRATVLDLIRQFSIAG